MLELLKTFFDICLLRKGPQALPRSGLVLVITLGIYAVPELARHVFVEPLSWQDLYLIMVSILAGMGFYGLVLLIHGYAGRFLQTATAIIGSGAILSVLLVLASALFSGTPQSESLQLIGLLLLGWSILIEGHIIAEALQQHRMVGVSLAIVVVILQFAVYVILGGNG